jgi:type IV pilus assembly protein PilY1
MSASTQVAVPPSPWLRLRQGLCLLLAFQLGLPLQSLAATINFATQPMATTTASVVKPNLLFVLDDSGSMGWDFMPDFVDDDGRCFDAGNKDGDPSISGGRDSCKMGDPPYTSPDFNKIYYNPATVYVSGVDANGVSKGDQTDLTNVQTDPYGQQRKDQLGNSVTTRNLTTTYPERVYCTDRSDTATDTTLCKANSGHYGADGTDYKYPTAAFPYGVNSSDAKKYRFGAPYYYRIVTSEHCTDTTLTSCVASTVPTGSHPIAAPVRYCKNSSPADTAALTDCQAKFDNAKGYTIPKFTGYVRPASSGLTAYASIDITAAPTVGLSIDEVNVNGVNAISTPVTGYTTQSSAATALRDRINAHVSSPDYGACVGTINAATGNTCSSSSPNTRVNIYSVTTPNSSAPNGYGVAVNGPAASGGSKASGTITITGTSAAPARITKVTVGGTTVSSGVVNAATGLNTSGKRDAFALALAGAISAAGYSATASGSVVTVFSPSNASTDNGKSIVVYGALSSAATITLSDNGNGDNVASVTALSNGGTVMLSSPASSAGGVNSSAERDSLATSLATNIASSGYTASASGNVVTAYTPINTTSTGTPSLTAIPAGTSANATATLTFTPSGTLPSSGSWRTTSIAVVPGGSCVKSDTNLMTGAPSSTATSGANVAARIDDKDDGADLFSMSDASNVLTINGSGANTGTVLNGCTINIVMDRTAGTGAITINGTPSTTDPHPFNGIAKFISSFATVTAFSGGYNSTSSVVTYATTVSMSGGSYAGGAIANTATTMGNGADPQTIQRMEVGKFQRFDIVPGADYVGLGFESFPKAAKRTDCAAVNYCTYAEEAKNFGNWYAYYRTRLQMMKSAAGRAFVDIGSNYRVGFMTISTNSSKYLKISDFDTTQKANWYTTFYNQGLAGGTPLRKALATSGRIFAGKNPLGFAATDDPMQYSCQQNFTLLTTDGYWNSNSPSDIKQIDGTNNIGNTDNVVTASLGQYDGNGSARSCPSTTASNCIGATSVTTNSGKYSSADTLADVAYYYYSNDLRTTANGNCTGIPVSSSTYDVCTNNVPATAEDPNAQQHMTTFTLGLGLDGQLTFRDDYKTATTGDFYQIKQGIADWPQPRQDDPTTLDDLWHAAVNGRGTYFSAGDPQALVDGLTAALAGVSIRLGSGAAAATSNLEPVAGDNFAYVASYTTKKWHGNVEARTVDTQTGVISAQSTWCVEDVEANTALSTTACTGSLQSQVGSTTDNRTIYAFDNAAADKLRSFVWGNLSATEQGYFTGSALSQWGTLTAAQKANVTGTNFVNFLRGQQGNEDQGTNGTDDRVFRDRERTLGDVIGSQPVYVKKPFFSYLDEGYAKFKADNASRAPTVFIGVNDGMLHAFNAEDGTERWAYVPGAVMPNLYKLADAAYESNHRYFVDGSPAIADFCAANCTNTSAPLPDWRTILVGGFNSGGRGFYALDITDPATPKALWEFTPASKFVGDVSFDADVGYSYGNSTITKLSDGTWAVVVTSGYNNVAPGDGEGYIYVLNPLTGAVIRKIGTGVGSTTTPSGLSRVVAYADKPNLDNKALFLYGGDLLGNLWRFDLSAAESTGNFMTMNPKLLATLKDGSGNAQPITARMELANFSSKRIIYAGTGKYLEASDIDFAGNPASQYTQSVYGIPDRYDEFAVDAATTGTIADVRSLTTAVKQTLTAGTDTDGTPIRTASGNAVNFGSDRNWYLDFDTDLGERVNVDLQLVGGTLLIGSNVPTAGVCNTGGYSYLNYLSGKTGGYVEGSGGKVSRKAGNALIVGFVVLKLATGFAVNATMSDNPTPTKISGVVIGGGTTGSDIFNNTRTSWREILTE